MEREVENTDDEHYLNESVETKSSPSSASSNQKFNLFLILRCLTASLASFLLGYNIVSTFWETPIGDFPTFIFQATWFFTGIVFVTMALVTLK